LELFTKLNGLFIFWSRQLGRCLFETVN
jgi:hypothetical protein